MMGMSCERNWMRGNGTIWPRSDYGPNRLVAPFLPFLLCLDARAHVEPSFLFNVLSFPPLVDLSPITPSVRSVPLQWLLYLSDLT